MNKQDYNKIIDALRLIKKECANREKLTKGDPVKNQACDKCMLVVICDQFYESPNYIYIPRKK